MLFLMLVFVLFVVLAGVSRSADVDETCLKHPNSEVYLISAGNKTEVMETRAKNVSYLHKVHPTNKSKSMLCFEIDSQDHHCTFNNTNSIFWGKCENGRFRGISKEVPETVFNIWALIPFFILCLVLAILKAYTLVLAFRIARMIKRSKISSPIEEPEEVIMNAPYLPQPQYVYVPNEQINPYSQQMYFPQPVPAAPLPEEDQVAQDEALARELQRQEFSNQQ